MIRKMIGADLRRTRLVNALLVGLMTLSALLAVTGVSLVVTLSSAVDSLMSTAKTPDVVQMHSGTLTAAQTAAIGRFADSRSDVTDHLTQRMLSVDNAQLLFNGRADLDDTQENSLVTQNERFDHLLDLNNRVLRVEPGQIAVPLYHRAKHDLRVGDTITIRAGSGAPKHLTVSSFLRDSTMNPGLASSKRFLISESDATALAPVLGAAETLIEFRLTPGSNTNAFITAYQAADLPSSGMAVTRGLFKIMSLITDGALAAIVILVSLLLVVIAALCLRFAFLTAAEDDRREIGVMKAIGIPQRAVKRLYLGKYALVAGTACVLGLLGSLAVTPLLVDNISLYNGKADRGLWGFVFALLPAVAVFGLLVGFCAILLRRINRVSALDALTAPAAAGAAKARLSLHRSKATPVHVRLGIMDVVGRIRVYLLTAVVFVVSMFIMIVPVNLATTVASPTFATYLGLAPSDIRVDLRNTERDMGDRFAQVQRTIAADPQVARHTELVSSSYDVLDPADGSWTPLVVENGDHAMFPLSYLEGTAATRSDQIALSWSLADNLKVKAGGTITLRDTSIATPGASPRTGQAARLAEKSGVRLTVAGVYQDVTNGGRTAKAVLPPQTGRPMWYVIAADLKPGADAAALTAKWRNEFAPARVTDAASFASQIVGETTSQVRTAAVVSMIVAALLAAVMTALFTQMLLARDRAAITIQTNLGAPLRGIRVQYLTRMWLVLLAGVITGTLLANLTGPSLISAVTTSLGATKIEFVTSAPLVYLVCPLLLFTVVGLAEMLATATIRRDPIASLSVE